MRIERWNSKNIFKALEDRAIHNANGVMDEVAIAAKAKLAGSVVQIPPIVREGHFGSANVSFTPKTGKNKGKLVQFSTDKRWTGRRTSSKDQLYDSLRRVNKAGVSNIRVYCGNTLAYWASMVEKTGYTDRGGKFHPPLHFLQAPFHAMKQSFVGKIAKGR